MDGWSKGSGEICFFIHGRAGSITDSVQTVCGSMIKVASSVASGCLLSALLQIESGFLRNTLALHRDSPPSRLSIETAVWFVTICLSSLISLAKNLGDGVLLFEQVYMGPPFSILFTFRDIILLGSIDACFFSIQDRAYRFSTLCIAPL